MAILSNQPKKRTRLCKLGSVYIETFVFAWSSQSSKSLMGRKTNGLSPDNPEAYRFAVDYRKLNAIIKNPRYPLTLIEVLITNIPHTEILSSLDLPSGYFQLAVKPSNVFKTAFVTKHGTYAFTCIHFGQSGAAPNFQKGRQTAPSKSSPLSDSPAPLISFSNYLSPNHPSVISCSSAAPVSLSTFDLLCNGRQWLCAHCKFSDALSSPNHHPEERCRTKRDQSGPEEGDFKSLDPTTKIQAISSSLDARVVKSRNRIQGADNQVVRIHSDTEEPDSKSARRW
ncbi:retrovirus-related Pol polyprotein from transposon 297 [Trichonephila clavipes]|nr:retrovirus-related Pol polyprotein from transposon 297 [Trichonephila clavipes]